MYVFLSECYNEIDEIPTCCETVSRKQRKSGKQGEQRKEEVVQEQDKHKRAATKSKQRA
jgi:hypothetical protein